MMMRCFATNQRGQIAVLFALIFPLFVLLMAFFVNMGLLINQKIRLQNAVDAGVYSATASYARDLSSIARLNGEMKALYDGKPGENKVCRWSESYSIKDRADNVSYNGAFKAQDTKFQEYQNSYHECLDRMEDISKQSKAKALKKGHDAALMTFYGGDAALVDSNPNHLEFKSLDKEAGKPLMSYKEQTTEVTLCYIFGGEGGGEDGNAFDPDGKKCDYKPKPNLPIEKTNRVRFAAELTALAGFKNIMPLRFRVGDEHYDAGTGEIILKAAAAGQPYNGSVLGGNANYRATLIPMKTFDGNRDELH